MELHQPSRWVCMGQAWEGQGRVCYCDPNGELLVLREVLALWIGKSDYTLVTSYNNNKQKLDIVGV